MEDDAGDSVGMTGVSVRAMTRSDIVAGLQLSRACKWNQIEDDWRCFLEFEGAGGYVAVRDTAPLGTIAFLRYPGAFRWIAMMLVDPQVRRAGIASLLMETALDTLRDDGCIGLDATPEGEPLYRRYGFTDGYSLVRTKVVVNSEAFTPSHGIVRRMEPSDLPEVFARDRVLFGADRSALLASFYHRAPELAWFAEHGYCFGRPGYQYNQVGPIAAEDLDTARDLLSHCLSAQHGRQFALDVPKHAVEWLRWMESVGFEIERPFLRMYRGDHRDPGLPDWQYGIAGPEFG